MPTRRSPSDAPRDTLAGGGQREMLRKGFHIASVAVPLMVWFAPRPAALSLLVMLVAAALGAEWARHRVRWARYQFLRRTRTMLRPHERWRVSGATYMAVAYLLAALLFPTAVAVAAMLYNGLGDAAAALAGRRFGRHRTRWGKSWEGFGAGLFTNLAAGLLLPGLPWTAALAGAATAATLEFLPLPLDDNLRVVLGGGAAAWLVIAG